MPLHDKLQTIFQEAFGIETLTDEMSIDTVDGWDSMAHVALVMTLQKEFNVSIAPADAIELTDIASIKAFLNKSWHWHLMPQPMSVALSKNNHIRHKKNTSRQLIANSFFH